LEWKAYASAKAMSVPLSILKSQISEIVTILRDKKSEMIGHNSVFNKSPKQVQLSIRSLASYVPVNEDQQEFYAFISPCTKKPSIRGKSSLKMSVIKHFIDSLATTLRHSEDYRVIHLTDEQMGITESAFVSEGGLVNLSPGDRAYLRNKFKEKLSDGIPGICINIFGRDRSGYNTPSAMFIWKSPFVHGDLHTGNVQRAIDECRDLLPKKLSAESTCCFNNIISCIANVPAKLRDALKDYLFCGELNVKGGDMDLYYDLVQNLASGLPIEESWILDGRAFNSRGGKGISSTKFEEFWEECRRYVSCSLCYVYI
jgi:hypothetical protein